MASPAAPAPTITIRGTGAAYTAAVPITHSIDGEPLAYRVVGAGAATPMLTVHGLVSSIQHWGFFNEHFAGARRVLSWEYRGHGGQPAPRDHRTATVAQFADDAHAVWRAAGMPPAIVTGLSFGVQVALELWRGYRDAVRALVLICGTAGHPLDRVSQSAALRRAATGLVRGLARRRFVARPLLALLRSHTGRKLACELAFASGGASRDACPREVLDDLFGHVAGLDAELLGAVVAGYLEHDAFDVLPTITVPTLIIAADGDQLTPVATAERMQRAIPNSELVVFSGHSHLVQVEQPREVHAAIDAFLAKHRL
jgi:pimeloyl-ACP methyl ester carboxylesterase